VAGIPLPGEKHRLMLGVTFGVLIQEWMGAIRNV